MNCNKMRQFKKVFTHLVLINKSLIAFPLDIEASFSLFPFPSAVARVTQYQQIQQSFD